LNRSWSSRYLIDSRRSGWSGRLFLARLPRENAHQPKGKHDDATDDEKYALLSHDSIIH